MTVGQMQDYLRSMSENLRYAAGRIRTLEKEASEQELAFKEASLADTLIRSGLAKDTNEAQEKIRKIASMSPVEVAAEMVADPMDMFVSDGDVPGARDENMQPILTAEGALEHFRSQG